MYPLEDGSFAPRNQWYVAAWLSEISRTPMERMILDEPVILYRTQADEIVALAGFCPHRGFPLASGKLIGDDIECPYHGLRFGPDGACTLIPSQDTIPAACRLRSYPVAARWQWLWIWMGDPALADETLIPDHVEAKLVDTDFRNAGGNYYLVPGRYVLLHDNLLDLNHVPFLHRDSFGGDGGGAIQVPEVTVRENIVTCSFSQPNIACPPFLSELLGYDGPVARQYISYFYAPCMHVIWDSISKLDPETGKAEPLGALLHIHAVTPATKNTAHYFQGEGQDFSHTEPCLAEVFRSSELVSKALDEDVSATRLIEQSIAACHGRIPEVLLKADKAAVLGRRILQAMIRAEDGGQSHRLEPADAMPAA